MADGVAIKWIVGLAIYFVVMFTISYTVNASLGTSTTSSGINELNSSIASSCDTPRSTKSSFDVLTDRANSIRCVDLISETQQQCEYIEGCSWINTSVWFGFIELGSYCDGEINSSYYGYNLTNSSGGYYAFPFVNVCSEFPDLQTSQANCEAFGCTYGEEKNSPFEQFSVSGVLSTIKWMMGFNVDFGVNFSGSFILAIFLFYIPALALLLGIRFLLPI